MITRFQKTRSVKAEKADKPKLYKVELTKAELEEIEGLIYPEYSKWCTGGYTGFSEAHRLKKRETIQRIIKKFNKVRG